MLHGDIQVNGTTVARWGAQRQTPLDDPSDPSGTYAYTWWVSYRNQVRTGTLDHDYADGAVALARAVLTEGRISG